MRWDDRFAIAFVAFAWLWLGGWIAASVIYRRRRGKPIRPRPPEDALFTASGVSGCSHRSWLTRIGGARKCLLVWITPTTLAVTPSFPFDLLFLPEVYDLEHEVALRDIRSLERRKTLLGPILVLRFEVSSGGIREFALRMRYDAPFVQALTERRPDLGSRTA